MTVAAEPMTRLELSMLRDFYIERRTSRLPASLNPSQSIPRLLATVGDPSDLPECRICGHYTVKGIEVHEPCLGGLAIDEDRLRRAIYAVSQRHDWEHSVDREDRTAEIIAEYTKAVPA